MTLVVLQVEEIWFFRYHNTTLSFHYWTLEPGNRYRHDSSGQWQHGDFNYNHQLGCTRMQDDSDLLSFECIFQLSSPPHIQSIENEPNLLLQNVTVVLTIVHPQAWLLIFLVVLCYAFGWSLVYSSLVRMPALPQSYSKAILSILLCIECDNPNSFFLRGIMWFLESNRQKRLLIFCLPISK